MLKGINPIVSPELLKALCEMVMSLLLLTETFLAKV
jgi:L-fucose mutarotase/ribose pyranase (RbsD/FucU family)